MHCRFLCRQRNSALIPIIVAASLVASCGKNPADGAADETPAASFLPAAAPAAKGCGESGYLRGSLFGAFEGPLNWRGASIDCQGMPRPDGRGARLRFGGTMAVSQVSIALIISIPDLEREATANELPSKVTLIEEGGGRFFSTGDLDSCWTDVERQMPIDPAGDQYSIDGRLYCITALAEVNGESSLSMSELSFSGLLDWSAQ